MATRRSDYHNSSQYDFPLAWQKWVVPSVGSSGGTEINNNLDYPNPTMWRHHSLKSLVPYMLNITPTLFAFIRSTQSDVYPTRPYASVKLQYHCIVCSKWATLSINEMSVTHGHVIGRYFYPSSLALISRTMKTSALHIHMVGIICKTVMVLRLIVYDYVVEELHKTRQ